MELKETFKFIYKNNKYKVFNAQLIGDEYFVTWETEDEMEIDMQPIKFPVKHVKEIFKDNLWNIIE